MAVNVFTNPEVLKRLKRIGAELYAYLPMSEDGVFMKELWHSYPNYLAINAGGNVGTASYCIAQLLRASHICLAGFDFGYPPGTPLEETQYFDMIQAHPELAEKMFSKVHNPHLEEDWFTDIVYLGYAHALVRIVEDAVKRGIETFQATGGGIVSSDFMIWCSLTDFLKTTAQEFPAT